ncbi:hypothetical protein E0Z10_g6059 [Xylaria hypoxylon]|uniref:Catalase core domain-containing protein n=1 Tax=Xylaria hypoxylon TaxID=37992 RepID=A0A4Z0YH35_9PEZI|nr:hypothetical protein E0Z10_g6059 [Xylaria hypoxylon]
MTYKQAIYTTAPQAHPYEAQRAGDSGPLLLQDFHLIDLLSHFDRERIPERVVHVKAGIFSEKGKKCPVTIRFFTVGGESDSHDYARDPPGFAVKFGTEQGNWDMVVNNTPIFFVRDPAKFPEFIHTQKRDPSMHLTHADDTTMFWDYLSHNPESIHQVMRYSPWEIEPRGEFILNENATNYFAETEQIAFSPSNIIPGIEPLADPALQSRLFSCDDTHRHRVGPNYQQLPIDTPRTAYQFGNFQCDGPMAFYNPSARPNYLSSIDLIQFERRKVDLDKIHGYFIGQAGSFLSEIRPKDFKAPRALRQKVFDEPAREQLIGNVSQKRSLCTDKEILKRQIAIFSEIDDDIAIRLEKVTGIKGYDGIADLKFNGTHNGMAKGAKNRYANGASPAQRATSCNGAPFARTHAPIMVMGVDGVA